MPKFFHLIFLFLLELGSLSAQSFLSGVNPYPEKISSSDTVKILAVMVNFQEDNDAATFGSGKFGSIYSKNYGNSILDPLPHDKAYFEAHLKFAQNYFAKISKGKQLISFTVLPDTFSVSKIMRNYSPPSASTDFTPLADFSKEVWTKADQLYPGFNFSNYNLFTIFHAGVGRDISLPGSLGNERDLPSLYLSPKAFKDIYGSSFDGISVSGGSFKINNSMILPETESRELTSFGTTYLFEITINGLLVASIASYLGLPDLFDTKTGLSAIGRFGLMDGQAIFAYNGIFPPEPSAWEKIYLGWAEPVVIDALPGAFNITVAANLIATGSDAAIVKIPINSSEYFLIENRIRDANADGAKVTYLLNGQSQINTFPKDTTGFQSSDVSLVDGVVVDIDEFDWAVPGNGLVIWHIDESVINAKITDNKINTDKHRRGVDVEEADGIQDIGEKFTTILGDVIIGEGSSQDFWYTGNPAPLFENRFSRDSRPNSNSNSGANSLITIKDFSPISNRMTFRLIFGDSLIKPIFSKQLNLGDSNKLELTYLRESKHFLLLSQTDLLIYNENGNLIKSFPNFSDDKPILLTQQNKSYVIGALGTQINLYKTFAEPPQDILSINIFNNEEISSYLIYAGNAIFVPTKSGNIHQYMLNDSLTYVKSLNSQVNNPILKAAFDNSAAYYTFITSSKFFENGSEIFSSENIKDLVLSQSPSGAFISVILTKDNKLFFINNFVRKIDEVSFGLIDTISTLSLGDLKNDGENYIVFSSGKNIEALNLTGVSADNFPFVDPMDIGFTGTPLIADFTNDSKAEVIAATKDGRIFAIDGGTGKVIDGFPISAGSELKCTPSLFIYDGKLSFAAIDKNNTFSAWQIGASEGRVNWSQENGNEFNQSFAGVASRINYNAEFFPSNRVYNYPNPVYDGVTAIRYYVSEDSKINIKIFDLAGDFIAEMNDNARGGYDNETMWDVGNIQSGVYLARVEANSASGKTESKVIKIAVVK